MKDYANMSPQEFAKVESIELQTERKNAMTALHTAMDRSAGEIDLDEVKTALDAVYAAAAALDRKHRGPLHQPRPR